MTKVALSIQPCLGNKSGIGVYTHEIVKRLKNDDTLNYNGHLFNFLGRKNIATLSEEYDFSIKECKIMPYGAYRRLWDNAFVNYNILFPEAEINHFFNYIVPPNVKGKIINTVYDLTYLRYPKTMEDNNLQFFKSELERSVNCSDIIVTISHFVKSELMQLMDVNEKKIKVVYCAAAYTDEFQSFENICQKFNIKQKPYLLYFGTIEPRKNLVNIIQAFNVFKEKSKSDIQLVLVGGNGWNNEEIYIEVGKSRFKEDIVFTGFVSDTEKSTLYANAMALVFVSIYEGFGIPILEAMHYGVPVVCSNTSSMPEVAGGCAKLVNPTSLESIVDGIENVVFNKEYREKLIIKGEKRALDFSWDNSAAEVERIHKELC